MFPSKPFFRLPDMIKIMIEGSYCGVRRRILQGKSIIEIIFFLSFFQKGQDSGCHEIIQKTLNRHTKLQRITGYQMCGEREQQHFFLKCFFLTKVNKEKYETHWMTGDEVNDVIKSPELFKPKLVLRRLSETPKFIFRGSQEALYLAHASLPFPW